MTASALSLLYNGLISIAVAAGLAPLERLKVLKGVAEKGDLEERLGRRRMPRRAKPVRILIHAVSAGEVAAAGALIAAVAAADPQVACVVTTGNRAGRMAANRLKQQFLSVEAVAYLPWDRRKAMQRFFDDLRPDLVILVEAEIWPNLLGVCWAKGIPVVIANGRLAARDVARYRLAGSFFAEILRAVEWVGVVSERDRRAYIAVGAAPERVAVMGNLKVDAPVSSNVIPGAWKQVFDEATGLLVVAGSTHAGEHQQMLEAFRLLRGDHPGLRLILAPRHPERFGVESVASELRAVRWSDNPRSSWDVLIVDTVGCLPAMYRWADVAFIGGSLVDRGGHNPLEAAAAGAAMVMGPSTGHFQEIVVDLLAAGGIQVLADSVDGVSALRTAVGGLLADPVGRLDMGRRARHYVDSCRGVADAYVVHLTGRLSGSSSSGRASTGIGQDTI